MNPLPRFLTAAAAAAGLFAAASTATAATFTVTNINDSGAGSLRQAVIDAGNSAGADTIVFDPSLNGQTIVLLGQISITTGPLTITATALPDGITLSGRGLNRIFSVQSAALDLNRLRLIRGNTGLVGGGAIYLDFGVLTLFDCTFYGNMAEYGGAILADTGTSRVNASGCTFERNIATADCGAVRLSGNFNTSTFANCTFSSNYCETGTGAVGVYREQAFFNHCTFTGNVGSLGTGGINMQMPITLNRCIIAGNSSLAATPPDIYNPNDLTITVVGANLIGNNGGSFSTGNVSATFPAGPLAGTPTAPLDPRLRPLGPSGGYTWTHAPLSNSAAINAGGASPFAIDQRGFPRDVGGSCDLGAVERGPVITISTSADSGAGSLRAAIASATQPDTRIQFQSFLNGVTFNLTTGPLDTGTKHLDIDASTLAGGVIISSNSTSRLFNATGGSLVLNRMILRDGFTAANGGAVLATNTGLTVVDVSFPTNRATGFGGHLAVIGGKAALHRCTLAGGMAAAGAGFYGEGIGRFLLSNCTVSGNTGGGVEVRNAGGELELFHCTVTGNTTGAGVTLASSSIARVENCVIAGNSGPTSPDIYRNNTTTVLRVEANLIGNNGGTGPGNVSDVYPTAALVGSPAAPLDALLAPLDSYGGLPFTRTHALRAGSPALNGTFSTSVLLRDQRGLPRVGRPDLGSYEAGQPNPSFLVYIWETLPPSATVADHDSTADFDGDGSSNYQEYLTNNDPANPAQFFRPRVRLADGLLLVSFPTVAGRSYTLESSTNLTTWTAQGTLFGDGQDTELFVSATGNPKVFARVRVSP